MSALLIVPAGSAVLVLLARCSALVRGCSFGVRGRTDRGQATAEYVLVLLGAASVALVLVGWLARSGRIEALLAQVFDRITAQL
jgi:hypothetical protein